MAWKGDISKSGGIGTNIGVHFFDMLSWIFGEVKKNTVHVLEANKAAGFLQLEKARVRWVLSLDYEDIPEKIKKAGKRTYRTLSMDGREIEFSDGFTDLHTATYQEILAGKGFRLSDAKHSVNIVYHIRNAKPIGLKGDYHPILKDIFK
jgi:UDP-N-acetyl-2-amino-2-deoxyglucuronate dehydrogenase